MTHVVNIIQCKRFLFKGYLEDRERIVAQYWEDSLEDDLCTRKNDLSN
jgi:hypothetical protein